MTTVALGPLERAILKTVVFADLFDYPLDGDQLGRRLMGYEAADGAVADALSDGEPLSSLVKQDAGLFFLEGRKDLVAVRARREASSQAYLATRVDAIRGMCKLPFVEAVALSGSLAHKNLMDGKRDVDLFVIFEGGRLWSGLASTWLYRNLKGKDFCLNYAVSAEELLLPSRSLFDAFQLLTLVPLMNLPGFEALWAANASWTGPMFPNWSADITVEGMQDYLGGRFDGRLAMSRRERLAPSQALPLMKAENRLRKPSTMVEEATEGRIRERWLAKRGPVGEGPDEVYGPHIFKRHDNSHRHEVMAQFAARMESLGYPLSDEEL